MTIPRGSRGRGDHDPIGLPVADRIGVPGVLVAVLIGTILFQATA